MFNIGKFVNNVFGFRVREQTTATDDMMLGNKEEATPNWHNVPKPKPWPAPPVHTPESDGYYDGYHLIDPARNIYTSSDQQSEYMKGWNQGLLDSVEKKPYRKQFNPKEPNMVKAINPVPPQPEMPKEEDNTPPYTIGITPDGKVQFQMTDGYNTMRLRMTQQGVIDLIEDLAHTIRKDYEVIICPEDQEEDEAE